MSSGSLTVNAASAVKNLTVSGGTFNAAGAITVNAALNLSSGTLGGAGTLTDNGQTTWSGGSLTGTLAVNYGLSITSSVALPSGGTLAVAPGVSVQLGGGQTFTDGGTVSLAAGDTWTFNYAYSATAQLVVGNTNGTGGLLTAAGTTFNTTSLGVNGSSSHIEVVAGGHLQASSCSFTLGYLELDNGSVLGAGDLAGNDYNSPLYLPATEVQYLSGTGTTQYFQAVNILGGTLAAGQTLALNAISATPGSLTYVFPSGFTVAYGATVTVAANVSVQLGGGQLFTDGGTLTFAAGDTLTFNYAYSATAQLVVGNTNGTGGLLTAAGTTFNTTSLGVNGSSSHIEVVAGGHLQASSCSFTLGYLELDNGSVLGAGDLAGNDYNSPLYLPATEVQYLSGTTQYFQAVNILGGTLAAGQTLALNAISATPGSLTYVFPSGFTVAYGATVTVAANVSVQLGGGQTFTDGGTVSLAAGDTWTFNYAYSATAQLVVGNTNGTGGLLTAAGTTFNTTSLGVNGSSSHIEVVAGGHLQASSCSFTLGYLELDNGSVLGAGDLAGNDYNSPLYLPATEVQYLSGTTQYFQAVNILGGTLAAGQTLALNAISATPGSLTYVFPSGFTVAYGATVTVAANVSVQLGGGQLFTDGGTLTFAAGDTLTFNYAYSATAQLVVGNTNGTGGLLTAAGTTFNTTSLGVNGSSSHIEVVAGGHLQASSCSFTLGYLELDNGSVLGAGDLAGNTYNSPLYLPATEVQYLSGTGTTQYFQAVNILGGTLAAGQTLALNAISATPGSLTYVFPSGFTVAYGATVTVAANVSVQLSGGQLFTDGGTVTFSSGDTLTFLYAYGATAQLVVGNGNGTGGLLTAAGTTFSTASLGVNSSSSHIEVVAGGRLQASSCSFTLGYLELDNGSVLGAGDLAGNTYNSPLYLPATEVQYLSGTGTTQYFQAVNILGGTLAAGQTLALNAISATPGSLTYVFPSGFTVAYGATVTVAANVSVQLGGGQTFTDGGTVSLAAGDTWTFNYAYSATAQLVVGNTNGTGGLLTAAGTTFNTTSLGVNGSGSQFSVNYGGYLNATTSSFSLSSLNLNGGSTDTLQTDAISGNLAINSGASISITGNNFSNIGNNGVIATGVSTATINLPNNYWGTTIVANILAKLLDHHQDSTRPTVNYGNYLTAAPAAITGQVFNDLNGNGIQDNGEPALGGVLVYIDANNNGVFDSGETSTVSQPNGQYAFYGLAPGTYVVREVAPLSNIQTAPTASAATTTVYFDGTGAEVGITTAGTTSFIFNGASFSGGAVFSPGQAALLASGTQAYNASSGNAAVSFLYPIASVSFFYVHGSGFAAGTATAYGADGSVLGTVNSKAATTNNDPANFVTLGGFAQPIARVAFSAGVIDNFTFTTAANNQGYYVQVQAGQTIPNINFGDMHGSAFQVGSATLSGNAVQLVFSEPIDPNTTQLYYSPGATAVTPDVSLIGPGGSVKGSLVLDATNPNVATFVATAGPLAAGSYLVGVTTAVQAVGGATLAANFSHALTAATPMPVVTAANFARGPGETVNVPNTSTGLPITVNGLTAAVQSISFTLTYDPTILTVTAAALSSDAATNGNLVLNPITFTSIDAHHMQIAFTVVGGTGGGHWNPSGGAGTLLTLTATVPSNAPYTQKALLATQSVLINGTAAQGDDAVDINAYPGDVHADGQYTGLDATLISRVVTGQGTGFSPFKDLDPWIIGSVTGSSTLTVTGLDATDVSKAVVGSYPGAIPQLPTGITITGPTGPDPRLYLAAASGSAGQTVTVQERLDVTAQSGAEIDAIDSVIEYDPSKFTVANLRAGSLLPGYLVVSNIDAVQGVIRVTEFSPSPVQAAFGTDGAVLLLDFTVKAAATPGPSPLVLAANDGGTATAAYNAAGALTLSPAPRNPNQLPISGGTVTPFVADVDSYFTVSGPVGAPSSKPTPTAVTGDKSPVTLSPVLVPGVSAVPPVPPPYNTLPAATGVSTGTVGTLIPLSATDEFWRRYGDPGAPGLSDDVAAAENLAPVEAESLGSADQVWTLAQNVLKAT